MPNKTKSKSIWISPESLPTDPNQLVNEEFVAKYYGVSTRTVKLWRYQGEGKGPRFCRVAKTRVLYRWGAILEHNEKMSAESTSEETVRAVEDRNAAA